MKMKPGVPKRASEVTHTSSSQSDDGPIACQRWNNPANASKSSAP